MTGQYSGPDHTKTLILSAGPTRQPEPERSAPTEPPADSSVRPHLLSEMDIYDLRDYLLATEF